MFICESSCKYRIEVLTPASHLPHTCLVVIREISKLEENN